MDELKEELNEITKGKYLSLCFRGKREEKNFGINTQVEHAKWQNETILN